MRHTMELALATIDANTHLHVSFDVDFLDADIAPGVGTTVKGGPTYREAQLCMTTRPMPITCAAFIASRRSA